MKVRLQRLQRSFGIIHWSVTYKVLGNLGRFRVSDSLRYYKPFFAGRFVEPSDGVEPSPTVLQTATPPQSLLGLLMVFSTIGLYVAGSRIEPYSGFVHLPEFVKWTAI